MRLNPSVKRHLDEVILRDKLSLFGKVLFFKRIQVFQEVPGITLSYLADFSHQVPLKEGESLTLDDRVNENFYIIHSGTVDFYEKGARIATFTKGQFLGEHVSLPQFLNTCFIIAKTDVELISINKDLFYEQLSDDVRLADSVLEYL
jgi:CRP-like cAMP-binding protein